MSGPNFDPAEAVTFDLQYGHVHLDGAPTRVMVPAQSLIALCLAAGEDEAAAFGHSMGEAMGRRVAVRIAQGEQNRAKAVRKAGFTSIVEHLAGEFALAGVGALSAERWGKALVFVVDQSPLGDGGDALLAEVLQAAVQSLVGKQGRVLCLHRDGVRARFLLVSGAVVQGVRERIDRGDGWGDVIAALHKGGPPA